MSDIQGLIAKLRETASKGVSVWGNIQMEAADALELLGGRTCSTCKHWDRITPYEVDECTNSEVRGMIETDYAGYDFMPPADFGCNRWEAK